MFIYKIKPNVLNSRYDAHRIVSSMFNKSTYTIDDEGCINVRTEESIYNNPYDNSEVLFSHDCGENIVHDSEQYMFNIDVYAQCIINNKEHSVPKENIIEWMVNKLNNAGFEVLDINKEFLGCENIQVTKGKILPTSINRFVGVIKVVDQKNANYSILNGFGKRKHLGLGVLELIR